MAVHKYKVGQLVEPASGLTNASSGSSYEIVSLLPSEGQEARYRVKRAGSPERVVVESQLSFVADAPAKSNRPSISISKK
jgi:hypothetical protein